MKTKTYILSVCFSLLFCGSVFGAEAMTDMKSAYINDLREQIEEIQQKIDENAATPEEIKWLEQFKKQLDKVEPKE